MEISLTYIQNLDRKNPEFSAPAITFYAIGQVKYTVWQSLWVIVVISLAMCIILAKMKYHLWNIRNSADGWNCQENIAIFSKNHLVAPTYVDGARVAITNDLSDYFEYRIFDE